VADRVRRRAWWEIVLVVLFAIMLLGLAATVLTGIIRGLLAGKPAAPVATTREPVTLFVNRSGGAFTRFDDALRQARTGDRIVIQDLAVDERVRLSVSNCPRGLTIEGEEGKAVVWRAPAGALDTDSLLTVDGVADLHFRNLTLDGGDRQQKLVLLTGRCPGLTLDNLELRSFKVCGVLVMNCDGDADKPVTLSQLRLTATQPAESALQFNTLASIKAIPANRSIRVRDCRCQGPVQQPVQNKGAPLVDVTFDKVVAVTADGKEAPVQLPK
jgi:hypothetical protein